MLTGLPGARAGSGEAGWLAPGPLSQPDLSLSAASVVKTTVSTSSTLTTDHMMSLDFMILAILFSMKL